ncbi:NAD(P)-dependent dehydrogenase (short-subunit alcohol dehydrogenase family) [Rhodococcus sp. SORGH_AS303]|nr:NAD(P)-dependent dehydrogenase (short-subunit alcohol dehydrogenase family) [Rhodococcus sp. SORGH_AS_0301]MDQ1202163.1 NAD(P)-dependent dehydrogenase (short-subunit alcohol dehydrogenase family) [Rhodococcus sp. SORGH_AS_0303]
MLITGAGTARLPGVGTLLDDTVVLVSGGTSGVGAAVVRASLAAGARVAFSGRRDEVGTAFERELRADGHDATFVRADIGDPIEAIASVERTVEHYGRVDAVCNAAGLTSRGSLLDTTPELFDQHMAVNLRGPFFVMQAAVRDMLSRSAPGTIVNIGSVSGRGGQSYLAPYVAAKAGLSGLTKNAAHAHRFDRIRINALDIGWTETEGEAVTQRTFHDAPDDWAADAAARMPMGKLGQPDEIADMVVFLLSPRSGVVTGSVIEWDQQVVGGQD